MQTLLSHTRLGRQIDAILSPNLNYIANAANVCAALFHQLPEVNWVGFYFQYRGELVVGPYQGLLACSRLPLTKGVCGYAVRTGQVVNVPDIQQFDSHIACDHASRSELVVPLRRRGRVFGVLDLDSPRVDRFSDNEVGLLTGIALSYERAASSLESHPPLD